MRKFYALVVLGIVIAILTLVFVYGSFFGFQLEPIATRVVEGEQVSNLESIRSAWGQFGYFFGGVLNPILGFASLLLILHSLSQNRIALEQSEKSLRLSEEALKINAEELRLSREEAKRAADALEANRQSLVDQYNFMKASAKKDELFKFASIVLSSIESWNKEKASDRSNNLDEINSAMSAFDYGYYRHGYDIALTSDAKFRLGLLLNSLASVLDEMMEVGMADSVLESVQSLCTHHAEIALFINVIDEETAKILYPHVRDMSSILDEQLRSSIEADKAK